MAPIRKAVGRSDEDNARTFAEHLENVFQANPATNAFTLPSVKNYCQLQREQD